MTREFKKSARCAQVVEQLTERLSVWKVPVTVAELAAATPDIPPAVYTHALRRMCDSGLLYVTEGERDLMFYFPVSKRPMSAIQEFLCTGRVK
jgi:hypothetical protein